VSNHRAVVVMPAYNAAETLRATTEQIPAGVVDQIILVDDKSRDDTIGVARGLGIEVICHPHNVGYGGNQKTCYMEALRQGADVVVMLHPDGQYDPRILGDMIKAVRQGDGDLVLGSRFLVPGQARLGGMPWWKRIANRFLTFCENTVLGLKLSEGHTGYRAYSRRFLETVPFLRNSNDFVFDSQIIAQAAAFRLRVAEVPVSTRYFHEASSVGFRVSLVYGLKTLATVLRYLLHRLGFRSRLFTQ
jgi:glycosyltransferase involved in cell wall biosynthesis